MSRTVRIMTDSASDLDRELCDRLGIYHVPLHVNLGDQSLADRHEISPDEFYKRIAADRNLVPSTSQVTPQAFKTAFEQAMQETDDLVYIAFSSGLSGTCQAAFVARDGFDASRIHIVDTLAASAGHGLLTLAAAEMAKRGEPANRIVESMTFLSDHIEHLFVAGSLEMLRRGGRVSKTTAILGGMLDVRPILHVQTGKIHSLENARGEKKALRRLVELMGERGDRLSEQTVAISYAVDRGAAERLRDMIRETHGTTRFVMTEIGAVVGSHAGPGTVALFFLNRLPEDLPPHMNIEA